MIWLKCNGLQNEPISVKIIAFCFISELDGYAFLTYSFYNPTIKFEDE